MNSVSNILSKIMHLLAIFCKWQYNLNNKSSFNYILFVGHMNLIKEKDF